MDDHQLPQNVKRTSDHDGDLQVPRSAGPGVRPAGPPSRPRAGEPLCPAALGSRPAVSVPAGADPHMPGEPGGGSERPAHPAGAGGLLQVAPAGEGVLTRPAGGPAAAGRVIRDVSSRGGAPSRVHRAAKLRVAIVPPRVRAHAQPPLLANLRRAQVALGKPAIATAGLGLAPQQRAIVRVGATGARTAAGTTCRRVAYLTSPPRLAVGCTHPTSRTAPLNRRGPVLSPWPPRRCRPCRP